MTTAPRTALIVGNGLSLDLRAHVDPALHGWNPSAPLAWCDSAGQPLLDNFPRFAAALRSTSPADSDFDRIIAVAEQGGGAVSYETTEIRHFLALAYTYFSGEVERLSPAQLLSWKWAEYLASIAPGLRIVFSFNYDLVLESVLEALGVTYRRVGLPSERDGVLVCKPHGSTDFETSPFAISMRAEWPISMQGDLVNTPIVPLEAAERVRPRVHPELVPPNQSSRIETFQWVAPGYEALRAIAGGLDQCIIVGHSYADVDRDEIDRLLDTLSPPTRVVVANPSDVLDLVASAAQRGLPVVTWRTGPI